MTAARLERGPFALSLAPELGGSIARFAFEGRDVLRPMRAGAKNPLETACFPLVPYANRIAGGAFRFGGRTVSLQRNFGDHPHSLHGHGWLAAWRVSARTEASVGLSFRHAADDWPWSYAAKQTFALRDDGLEITLEVANESGAAMPFSLGFHPYFPRSKGTRLTTDVEGVWLTNDTSIPTERAARDRFLDLSRGADLATAPFVDHCHYGWSREARIDQPASDMRVRLSASPELDFLHVYAPVGENYFCAEPVSAMPNAFNASEAARQTGLRVLAAGASARVTMSIAVE